MSTSGTVRFNLFGGFVAIVDGSEVTFPERDFYSYLKLLLLSGKTRLEPREAFSSVPVSKRVRDVLDLGNSAPGLIRKGGRYAFEEKTGLSLKYREGYGLELRGADSQSDVREFERIWKVRSDKSEQDLQYALDIYGSGIDLDNWIKDWIIVECQEWIKTRLHVLQERRNDIKAELDSKRERRISEPGSSMEGVSQGCSDEEGSRHETSGFGDTSPEFSQDRIGSAALGEAMCELSPEKASSKLAPEEAHPSAETPRVGADMSETNNAEPLDPSLSGQETENKDGTKMETKTSDPQPDLSSSSGSRPVGKSSFPERKGKRTVTNLGIVVAVGLVLVILLAGYGAAKLFGQSESQGDQAAKGGDSGARSTTPGAVKKESLEKKSDVDNPEYRVPVLENPVPLATLYLQDLAGQGTEAKDEDVVIDRQLFTGYLKPWGSGVTMTSAVFKLDRQFTKLNCLVGVPDADAYSFEPGDQHVVFEGDGKVLKRIQVKPGQAVPLELSVRNVRALTITFNSPVVIVDPKVWR